LFVEAEGADGWTPRWCSVGVISGEGRVIKRATFWVAPHVSRDGANASVEGVPRTLSCEVSFTLVVEMTSSANAAFSMILLLSAQSQRETPRGQMMAPQ
jgi:hypothetical protein